MIINHDRMLLAFVSLLALVFTPLLVSATDPIATDAPRVIISEIGWSGSEVSDYDEWLELTNLDDEIVDISGWLIVGAATGGDVLVLPENVSLQPNATYLIANYDSENEKSTLAVVADFVTSSLSLSNSTLGISLQNAAGTIIDTAGAGDAPAAGNSGDANNGQPNVAMRRIECLDGASEQAWTDATETIGFDAGAKELGTPGTSEIINNCETYNTYDDPNQNDPPNEDKNTESANSDTASQTDPADPATTSVSTLIINEFVSDPVTGTNEWVEIYNPNDCVVILDGWSIRESSGKTTTVPNGQLGYGEFVVIESISGNLNNDGDTIELLDPTGTLIDNITYGDNSNAPAVNDPNAVARDTNGEWMETTVPTPGLANIISISGEPATTGGGETTAPETSATAAETANETTTIEPCTTTNVDLSGTGSTTNAGTAGGGSTTQASTEITATEGNQTDSEYDTTDTTVIVLDLRLSEIYPNTTGTDSEEEFVELTNIGSDSVDLLGWSLTDTSGKTYTVETSQIISPGSYLTLYRDTTDITLNNSGTETISLIAPDGTTVDQFTYETSTKGESFILLDGVWTGTSLLTPNEPNGLSSPQAEPEPVSTNSGLTLSPTTPNENSPVTTSTVKSSTTTSTTSSVIKTDAASVRNFSIGTRVQITGTVSAEPGLFGSQIMYLAGSGVQIYLYAANWPELQVGDLVQVTGEISTNRDETRIKLDSAEDVVWLNYDQEPIPHEIELTEINENTEGWLVMITGLIQSVDADQLILEDNGTTATVLIKENTEIDPTLFTVGSRISATGIVSRYYDDFRVLPRSTNDLKVMEETAIVAAGTTSKNGILTFRSGMAMGITFLTLTILGYLAIRHYRNLKESQQPAFSAETIDYSQASN